MILWILQIRRKFVGVCSYGRNFRRKLKKIRKSPKGQQLFSQKSAEKLTKYRKYSVQLFHSFLQKSHAVTKYKFSKRRFSSFYTTYVYLDNKGTPGPRNLKVHGCMVQRNSVCRQPTYSRFPLKLIPLCY